MHCQSDAWADASKASVRCGILRREDIGPGRPEASLAQARRSASVPVALGPVVGVRRLVRFGPVALMDEHARAIPRRRTDQLSQFFTETTCLLGEFSQLCVEALFRSKYFFHGVSTHAAIFAMREGAARGMSRFRANADDHQTRDAPYFSNTGSDDTIVSSSMLACAASRRSNGSLYDRKSWSFVSRVAASPTIVSAAAPAR
jgi:hypothetical protein